MLGWAVALRFVLPCWLGKLITRPAKKKQRERIQQKKEGLHAWQHGRAAVAVIFSVLTLILYFIVEASLALLDAGVCIFASFRRASFALFSFFPFFFFFLFFGLQPDREIDHQMKCSLRRTGTRPSC